eukprot:SAG31_NODE_1924_length_6902_cov_5.916066_8_plen_119_part_00
MLIICAIADRIECEYSLDANVNGEAPSNFVAGMTICLFLRPWNAVTIEVLKVTSNTLRETSGLFFVPFVEWLALAGLLIYFLAGTALIWTTRFSTADLKVKQKHAQYTPDALSNSLCG